MTRISKISFCFLILALLCQRLIAEELENNNEEWLPKRLEETKPFLGDPRAITYSIAFRFHDQALAKNTTAVSLGDELALYQWNDIRKKGDHFQIGIHGCIWSVFNLSTVGGDILELINTDFLIGLPVTYSCGDYAIRARFYHLSSHLGDEFLLNNPSVERKNPSFETIDVLASYRIAPELRFYGGFAYVLQMDPSYRVHRLSIEYGFETSFGETKDTIRDVFQEYFLTMHMRHLEDRHWNYDGTLRLGTEFSKLSKPNGRKVRAYFEYHEGYSIDGQFSKGKTDYLSFNFGFGY